MEILVFKTNIHNKKQIHKIKNLLSATEGIMKWNVDLDDTDKVLRIETMKVSPQYIENLIGNAGFICNELTD